MDPKRHRQTKICAKPPVGAINDNNLHLLVALLVPLQQLLADVGGELEVPLLLLEEPGDGLDIVIGPDMNNLLVRSDNLGVKSIQTFSRNQSGYS